MLRKLYLLLIITLPATAFAQAPGSDLTDRKILTENCDDKIFTKVEILPSFRKGVKNFEDTLTIFLKREGFFNAGSGGTYRFIVSTSSKIVDFARETGNLENEKAIGEFIRACSYMWKPALQNGNIVCAYVRLEIEISYEGILKATIK